MDARRLDDCAAATLLSAASCANTAAATSGNGQWLDMSNKVGDVLVVLNAGAITGSLTGKLQCADDANGTNAVDIPGYAFPAATANTSQELPIDSKVPQKRYLGFVGTIVTGPAVLAVTAVSRKNL